MAFSFGKGNISLKFKISSDKIIIVSKKTYLFYFSFPFFLYIIFIIFISFNKLYHIINGHLLVNSGKYIFTLNPVLLL